MGARGRIPYDEADPATLRHVADSLAEDAERYARVVRLNPSNSEEQKWVANALTRNAKKLLRLATIIENKRQRAQDAADPK